MGHATDCLQGWRCWRRREVSPPGPCRMPPPPRPRGRGRIARPDARGPPVAPGDWWGFPRAGAAPPPRVVGRVTIGEVMVGAWPERTVGRQREVSSVAQGIRFWPTRQGDRACWGLWLGVGRASQARPGLGVGRVFLWFWWCVPCRPFCELQVPLLGTRAGVRGSVCRAPA